MTRTQSVVGAMLLAASLVGSGIALSAKEAILTEHELLHAGTGPEPDSWAEAASFPGAPIPTDLPTVTYPDRRSTGPAINVRRQPTGALTGRHVYIGGGHGWTFDSDNPTTGNAWYTQRGNNLGIVEDLGNVDQMGLLALALWNAGATVIPTRPVGFQNNEIVMDQNSPGVTYTGTWANVPVSSDQWYFRVGADDPTQIFRAATASTTETATARYTPNIPEPGIYPVYTYVMYGPDRVDQLYRIRHAGGMTEVRINHRRVGRGMVWLGSYYFNTGSEGYVEISNQKEANDPGTVVIADGIRFGNGMGDLDFGQGVSGFSRQEEASRYWAQVSLGVDPPGTPSNRRITSVYDASSSHQNDNVGTPPRTAAWMNNETQSNLADRLYIGLHTNAAGGRGAVGLYNNINITNARTPNQIALATLLGREINEDMQQLDLLHYPEFPRWSTRTVHTYTSPDIDYGEQRWDSIGREMDASILEIAFHDHQMDAHYLRDGRARRQFAKSTTQAAIRYFNQFGGGPLEFPPDEPRNVRIVQAPGGGPSLLLKWDPPEVITSTKPGTPGPVSGGAPTGYTVYIGTEGSDVQFRVATPNVTMWPLTNMPPGTAVHAVVTARNAGGESFPGNVASGMVGSEAAPHVLVVDAFDKHQEPLSPRQTVSGIPRRPDLGTFGRINPRIANDFSYAMTYTAAIAASGGDYKVDSVRKSSVLSGEVNLADYRAVIWYTGKEGFDPPRNVSYATVPFDTEPIDQDFRTLLETYVLDGGNLLLTGQDNIQVLAANSPTGERARFRILTLRTNLVTGTSNTLQVQGAPGDIFEGLSFSLGQGQNIYTPNSADVLSSISGGRIPLQYVGGQGGGAATLYDASSETRGSTLVLGFPFETIASEEQRALLMGRALEFLIPSVTQADVWALY